MQVTKQCPFCEGVLNVDDCTSQAEERAGLTYLSSKCAGCKAVIDGVGRGPDAMDDLDGKIRRRKGTRREDWLVRTAPGSRRRSR